MIVFDDIGGRRFLARLDPRLRVVCVAVFAVMICLCERPTVLLAGISAATALTVLAGVPARHAARRLAAVNLLMLLLVLTMPISMPGGALVRIGAIAWSRDGVWRAVLIALRANAVMFMVLALLGTMETAHLGFALGKLRIPDKFVHLMLFMVRYIDVMHHEYHHLRDAMRLRGFRPRFDRHTFRSLGFLVGELLVRSLERSEHIMQAMLCRGFRGRFYILTPCRFERADAAFAAAVAAGMLALAAWEWL